MAKQTIAEANLAIPEEERQPTRRGLPEAVRTFDQTYLDPAAEIVHRDYAAHFFRWGFAKKNFIEHEKTRVLDVGCGPDRPLMLALFGGIGPHPLAKAYTGVDLNHVKPTRHARSKIYAGTNFFERWEVILTERGPFELITNFEVIEHMRKQDGLKLLQLFEKCLAPGGRILLSTPVYDGKGRARNHIHEYTIPELEHHVQTAGLVTIKRYGTFANIIDIKKAASMQELEVMSELSEWYGNDVLSTFLAPLYPDASRNNCWVLGRRAKK